MPGGIVFTATDVKIGDGFGGVVTCTSCGGQAWDITLRGGELDRIECSDTDCGQPVTVDEPQPIDTTGR